MKHLPFAPTPITRLEYSSSRSGANIICKRDDLFAEAGGGSKSRMLQYILAEVENSNCDVLVTAGGPCSNFNRACALMCAKLGVPMHLVEYTDNLSEFETSLNYFLCNLAGIRKTRCLKTEVADTIENVKKQYSGKNVKFIYGGGKSLEGFFSYYDAVNELKSQVENLDHVFVACGTGTTLTGICAGMHKYFPNAKVHAISVARSWDTEKDVLNEDMALLNQYLKAEYDFSNLDFSEDYLCGGYDCTTPELLECIRECVTFEGMIVDPCYSGKAFYGMTESLRLQKDLYKGKDVLFWNTGGIMNLLSMKDCYTF